MKKLINDPRHVVRELLEGLVDLTPELALLETENVVVRRDLPPPASRKVAIISGGGSGHEPAHAGYVGHGMLTAAVAGDVFTSPSTDAVLAAITAAAGPAGALLVVKNYTGDRLNFGLAAELARQQGIPVELVFVADDVALRGIVPNERRRGIAGTILVHKLAGAAAEQGKSLAEVTDIARRAAADLGSMGVGLGTCIVPTAGAASFELGANEIELGLGIHGEKGVERTAVKSADEITDTLVSTILEDRKLGSGSRVALLVNGLGGTSAMELLIVARRAMALLRARNIEIGRAWCGNYLSAMEMPGVSISVLTLDKERDALFSEKTSVAAWPANGDVAPARAIIKTPTIPSLQPTPGPLSGALKAAALAMADALDAAEPRLTHLDGVAGDGDLGASMQRGAESLRALAQEGHGDPSSFLTALAGRLRRTIAGSSGPFYATALLRAGSTLQGKSAPTSDDWRAAFQAAVTAIADMGGAKPGDRTMLDALFPAIAAWQAGQFSAAVSAAEDGAQSTARMKPVLGRAAYLGDRAIGEPDGGAVAVTIWMRAILQSLGD